MKEGNPLRLSSILCYFWIFCLTPTKDIDRNTRISENHRYCSTRTAHANLSESSMAHKPITRCASNVAQGGSIGGILNLKDASLSRSVVFKLYNFNSNDKQLIRHFQEHRHLPYTGEGETDREQQYRGKQNDRTCSGA